jgi:hypothetical protein
MEVERQSLAKGDCSSPREEEVAWKECWNLNIPNVAKMFLWRVGHNLLPTKMNLLSMHCGSACLWQMCGVVDQFDYKKVEPKGGLPKSVCRHKEEVQ